MCCYVSYVSLLPLSPHQNPCPPPSQRLSPRVTTPLTISTASPALVLPEFLEQRLQPAIIRLRVSIEKYHDFPCRHPRSNHPRTNQSLALTISYNLKYNCTVLRELWLNSREMKSPDVKRLFILLLLLLLLLLLRSSVAVVLKSFRTMEHHPNNKYCGPFRLAWMKQAHTINASLKHSA